VYHRVRKGVKLWVLEGEGNDVENLQFG
jgi:hypothetical protein